MTLYGSRSADFRAKRPCWRGACLFYRDQLERLNHPDFRVSAYSAEEEKAWLSRDADFATTEPEKMPDHAVRSAGLDGDIRRQNRHGIDLAPKGSPPKLTSDGE